MFWHQHVTKTSFLAKKNIHVFHLTFTFEILAPGLTCNGFIDRKRTFCLLTEAMRYRTYRTLYLILVLITPPPPNRPKEKKMDPRIITSCSFDSENEDQKRQAIHWVSLWHVPAPQLKCFQNPKVLEVVVSRTADQSVNNYPGLFP